MDNKETSIVPKTMQGVYRTTKCFGAKNQNKYKGGFPSGFINWLKKMNWWGERRVYLCAGKVDDSESIRVDIKEECNPTHLEDARNTSLEDECADCVIIDPPYLKELSKELYGTEEYYHGINAFTKEAERICSPKGLIITLSYEIPKRIPNCDFIAVCGVYQIPAMSYMRCFTVSRKNDK